MGKKGTKSAGSRKEPRQARSRRMRDDLLAGATRVLEREGATGFTTNRVAEVTGVSVGSLYQYYPNKGALLSDLHESEAKKLWAQMETILGDRSLPARERFETIVARSFEVQGAASEHHAALSTAGLPPSESEFITELFAHARATLAQFLAEEAPLHPKSPEDRAAFCVEVLFALLEQGAKKPEFLVQASSHAGPMLALYLGLR